MRCIETGEDTVKTDNIDMINYNMRCIETILQKVTKYVIVINYNMRCIETEFPHRGMIIFTG